jgi:hypothetical protein
MIAELDRAVLTTDLPEHGLRAGDLGTVVMVHDGGAGYTIEFVSLSGETVAVVTLPASHLRPVRANEIANARELAPAP